VGNPYQQWPQGGPAPEQNVPPTAQAAFPPGAVQYPPGTVPYGQGQVPYGQPQPGGPQYWGQPPYGAPAKPSFNFAALDRKKLAAGVVALCGLVVLIGSFFSLYSITVTPSALTVRNNDAPAGQIDLGIGFYDVFPIPPPVVAQAIPLLMILAALTAAPAILGTARKISSASAVFAGAAALLAFVLAVANPLPSIDVTGQLADRLDDKVGNQSVDQLVDSVVSIGPGAGLIVALIFALIGWAAATAMVFLRSGPLQSGAPVQPQQQPPPQQPYPGPNVPPTW
jgi:hypothetical protein